MNPARAIAMQLRLQGRSYNEIHAALGVPKSTMNGWFRHLVLSDTANTRLLARMHQGTVTAFVKRNKLQTHHAEQRARAARAAGKNEIPPLSDRELQVVGAALYWAEGYKRLKIRDGKERMNHPIRFVNSDPDMIRVFIQFLRRILDVSSNQITLSMRLYAHIGEEAARAYWMKVTGLPEEQFRTTTYLVSGASKRVRPYNRLPWGTLELQTLNTSKFHRLMGLIEGVKEGFGYGSISKLPG